MLMERSPGEGIEGAWGRRAFLQAATIISSCSYTDAAAGAERTVERAWDTLHAS